MKIRSMQSPVYIDMFKNMGMLPTALPASELYTSLQTGVVDAGENDAASVVSWGWVDVIKYYSLDEHSLTACVLLLNKKRFDSFSPEIQKAIREAGKKAELFGVTGPVISDSPEFRASRRSCGQGNCGGFTMLIEEAVPVRQA